MKFKIKKVKHEITENEAGLYLILLNEKNIKTPLGNNGQLCTYIT